LYFQAGKTYEKPGLIAETVLAAGLVERGDEVWMYYGAGDSTVRLATARTQDLLR